MMVTHTQHARLDTEAFSNKAFTDFTTSIGILLAVLGDRLGLFKTLAELGPVTSDDLASTTGLDGRYVREWMNGMVSSGYLEYISDRRQYVLPEEWVPVLADEGGPAFIGGTISFLPHVMSVIDDVEASFRTGGGVDQSRYDHRLWHEMQRQSAGFFNHMLVQLIIPSLPGAVAELERGARVADLGSGAGVALIQLAKAYPASVFVGYDSFPAQVALATENARKAGVADRVEIRVRDVEQGLDDTFDVITSFDVVHDAAHPSRFMERVHAALEPDGVYAMVEPGAGETLEDNIGPVGTFLYGSSIFYCMTTSLAQGGEGFGTAGLPPSRVRALAREAGFASVEQGPCPHPLYALYVLSP